MRRQSALLVAVAVALLAVRACGGARFGDRLLPRVPLHYAGRSASSELIEAEPEARVARKIDPDERGDDTDTEPPHAGQFAHSAPAAAPPVSRTEAHRLEMSTEYFAVPAAAAGAAAAATRSPPAPPAASAAPPARAAPPPPPTALRAEPWAAPVLALALACMAVIAGFEAFALYMTRRAAAVRRHAFLGRTLIAGLFLCAAVAASLAAAPTAFTCGAMRFGGGVACALVFAALLVKCVFLVSLNGGVYLPAAYQALLLFFASLIQVTIGAQWLGASPPRVVGSLCRAPLSELLLSLTYVMFLIACVAALALKSRGIRDNYREARHVGAAAGGACVAWLGWVSAALAAPERHRDACLAAGLLATAAAVFVPMFAPEARRLAAAGDARRRGRDDADADADSRAASGYSPSFFHFKPVKYGVVGVPPPPQPPPPPAAAAAQSPALPATQPPSDRRMMVWPASARYWGWHYAPPIVLYPPPPVRTHITHPSHMPHALPYHCFMPPPPGVLLRSDENNVYTTLEPTFSSNPNVYFQRNDGGVHPGMMY